MFNRCNIHSYFFFHEHHNIHFLWLTQFLAKTYKVGFLHNFWSNLTKRIFFIFFFFLTLSCKKKKRFYFIYVIFFIWSKLKIFWDWNSVNLSFPFPYVPVTRHNIDSTNAKDNLIHWILQFHTSFWPILSLPFRQDMEDLHSVTGSTRCNHKYLAQC